MIEQLRQWLKQFLKILENVAESSSGGVTREKIDEAQSQLQNLYKELSNIWTSIESQSDDVPKDIVKVLVEARAALLFGLSVALDVAVIIREGETYLDRELAWRATGQRILSSIEYLRPAHAQLYRRIELLAGNIAILKLLSEDCIDSILQPLFRIQYAIQQRTLLIAGGIQQLEERAAKATAGLNVEAHALGTVLPCDLDKAQQEPDTLCIALYRGLHFRRDYFSDLDVFRQRLASLDHIPAFSEEVRTQTKADPGLIEARSLMEALEKKSEEVSEKLRETHGVEVELHWKSLPRRKRKKASSSAPAKFEKGDQYFNLIQRYINSYGMFRDEIGKSVNKPDLYKDLGFQRTPFVSFTFNPRHAVRYALGVKTPKEQAGQRRRAGYIGEVYVYLVPLTPSNRLKLNNIRQAHEESSVAIDGRILNEIEVTALGGLQSVFLAGRLVVGRNEEFRDPFEKVPNTMPSKEFTAWEQQLALSAMGCALSEAMARRWKLRGLTDLPELSLPDFDDPYFGCRSEFSQPDDFEDEERSNADRHRILSEKLLGRLSAFASVEGTAKALNWSSSQKEGQHAASSSRLDMGTFIAEGLAYPATTTDFLEGQNAEAQDSLKSLLQGYSEGEATPLGHNCLIHTIAQLRENSKTPNVDFEAIRRNYGLLPNAMIQLETDGHRIAIDAGLCIQVFALNSSGHVQYLGEVGRHDGRPVALLHFGAHYVPLWPTHL